MTVAAPDDQARVPDPRVARAAQGDRAAAQALLVELLPRIRNLVRYLVRGDADVDDIAQLVLVQLLRAFAGYRGEGSLTAFADRITVRVALGHARKGRREESQRRELGPELRAVSSHPEQPDDYTLRRQTVRWLDALPNEQRDVIVLHHVAGLSVPELASELALPFETARSRLRLGMMKLREQALRSRGKP
jgi:RNA polymerase sigma-70 factor (ECF subfamily)